MVVFNILSALKKIVPFCVAIISAAIYNEAGPFFAREKARFPF